MAERGWVASDATTHSLKNLRPDWVSVVSVAVAVKDISEFNDSYSEIVSGYMKEHGIERKYPVFKSDDIGRWADDWEVQNMIQEMTEELLHIDSLDTIQITETSLHSRWVTIFSGDGNHTNDIKSEEFINKYLGNYYNIISIWEYLNKPDSRPRTHRNILTDDFTGNISPAWLSVGEKSDQLRIVPKGDETYPLLSMADILMEYIKQEVDKWNEKQIYEHLKSKTPTEGVWIDSDGIDTDEELSAISPTNRTKINTSQYYPSPTLYIESGGIGSDSIRSLDIYDHLLAFARQNNGCVKFFNESQDRAYLTSNDYLICLDNNCSKYDYIDDLNYRRNPRILNRSETLDLLADKIGI